jgi:hypothetical protein
MEQPSSPIPFHSPEGTRGIDNKNKVGAQYISEEHSGENRLYICNTGESYDRPSNSEPEHHLFPHLYHANPTIADNTNAQKNSITYGESHQILQHRPKPSNPQPGWTSPVRPSTPLSPNSFLTTRNQDRETSLVKSPSFQNLSSNRQIDLRVLHKSKSLHEPNNMDIQIALFIVIDDYQGT